MFEGKTTITFSKEATRLMLSENVSRMFNMALEVLSYEDNYDGLKVEFGRPEPEKTADEGNIVEALEAETPVEAVADIDSGTDL